MKKCSTKPAKSRTIEKSGESLEHEQAELEQRAIKSETMVTKLENAVEMMMGELAKEPVTKISDVEHANSGSMAVTREEELITAALSKAATYNESYRFIEQDERRRMTNWKTLSKRGRRRRRATRKRQSSKGPWCKHLRMAAMTNSTYSCPACGSCKPWSKKEMDEHEY